MNDHGTARAASPESNVPDEDAVELLLAMSTESSGGLGEEMRRGLELATSFFGLEFGIVSRVEGTSYVIEHVHQPPGTGLEIGQSFELGDTYCAITLEASDVVSIDEMRSSPFSGHPCYDQFQLESYLGVPLWVDGKVHGTLNFSAPSARPRTWTETDRQLVRMLARWVEGSISQDRLRRRLARTLSELDRANRELTARNEDLDSFAHHASHDLQAPLRNVVGLVHMLTDDLGDQLDPQASGDVELIEREIDRMTGIVQALLCFARTGEAEVSGDPIGLDACARSAVAALQTCIDDAGARVTIGELPTIQGSEALLTQVFQNLIGNGIKFRREGVRPEVEITGRVSEGIAEVSVRDNGIGFDAKHKESIFAPLARLHGAGTYEGSGLGLAIVRKIVGRHGGTVTVDSTPGEGSVFRLSFGAPAPSPAAASS